MNPIPDFSDILSTDNDSHPSPAQSTSTSSGPALTWDSYSSPLDIEWTLSSLDPVSPRAPVGPGETLGVDGWEGKGLGYGQEGMFDLGLPGEDMFGLPPGLQPGEEAGAFERWAEPSRSLRQRGYVSHDQYPTPNPTLDQDPLRTFDPFLLANPHLLGDGSGLGAGFDRDLNQDLGMGMGMDFGQEMGQDLGSALGPALGTGEERYMSEREIGSLLSSFSQAQSSSPSQMQAQTQAQAQALAQLQLQLQLQLQAQLQAQAQSHLDHPNHLNQANDDLDQVLKIQRGLFAHPQPQAGRSDPQQRLGLGLGRQYQQQQQGQQQQQQQQQPHPQPQPQPQPQPHQQAEQERIHPGRSDRSDQLGLEGRARGFTGTRGEGEGAGSTGTGVVPSFSLATAPTPAPAAITATAPAAPPRLPRQSQQKQPGINLHNKVEKRYRSNVKNALDLLRDSVPRLRQIYGTSLPSETEEDREDENGLVAGLARMGKPTKQTIMLGAKMYVEFLEVSFKAVRYRLDRAEERLRTVDPVGFEGWVREVALESSTREKEWREELERKMRERSGEEEGRESSSAPSGSGATAEGDEEDEEEEEEVRPTRGRPKKRSREESIKKESPLDLSDAHHDAPVKKQKTRKGAAQGTGAKVGTVGAGVLYSFGLVWTLFPRTESSSSSSASGNQTNGSDGGGGGEVLFSAPYRKTGSLGIVSSHPSASGITLGWIVWAILGLVLVWITWRVFGNTTRVEKREDGSDRVSSSSEDKHTGLVDGFKRFTSPLTSRGDEPKANKAWLKLIKGFVGGSRQLDIWSRARVQWRLARMAPSDPEYALLQALHNHNGQQWAHARTLALDSSDKTLIDVLSLSFSEVKTLKSKLGPVEDPVRAIADYLTVTHLDDLATRLYISLVESRNDSGQVERRPLASLADPRYKSQIFEALVGVPKGSDAYALGLVLIGLWGVLGGQDASAQRSVANILIAGQMKGHVDLPSVDAFLNLVAPGYRSPASRSPSAPAGPGVHELDTLLNVCLRYVTLVRKVAMKDPAHRSAIYHESVAIRQLLGQPTFQRTFKDIFGYRVRNGSSASDTSGSDTESIASSDEESISAIEAEVEAFDKQTDRLIDTLVGIGRQIVTL